MNESKPLAIILHGLHMNPWMMRPLARKLSRAGFRTHSLGYHSLANPIETHSSKLNDWLSQHHPQDAPLYLVGHSLGGLVIRHFLATYPDWQVMRSVTLGTPHQGSTTASYVKHYLPQLVSHAYIGALDGTCPLPPHDAKIGVIAGSRPWGLGLPFITLHSHLHRHDTHQTLDARINDGTVYLSESRLNTAADYLILPTSHSGLVSDKTAAMQTVHFLKYGEFYRDD